MIYGLPLAKLPDQRRGDRQLYVTTLPTMILGWSIPAGFLTDLVSASMRLRGWLGVRNVQKMSRSALLHDALMNCTKLSRWKCNALMYRQMKRDKVPWNIRITVWLYLTRPWAPRNNWPQPYLEGEVRKL